MKEALTNHIEEEDQNLKPLSFNNGDKEFKDSILDKIQEIELNQIKI